MSESNCLMVCPNPLEGVPGQVADIIGDAFCVAVDGGLAHFKKLKLKPQLWVGDADSVRPADLKKGKFTRVKLSRNKSYTDLEYALHLAGQAFLEGHWEGNVILVGAQGGRFDHDIGNLLAVHRFLQDLAATVGVERCPGVGSYGRHGLWIATVSDVAFHQPKKEIFSVVMFEQGPKLTITGAKYNLKKKPLEHASMGLSNEGLGKTVQVLVHQNPNAERLVPAFIFLPGTKTG